MARKKGSESSAADSAPLPASVRAERQQSQCDRSAAAIPADAPDAMREFMKRPGARFYGEFRYWRDETAGAALYALKKQAPDDHLLHEFSSGPNAERVDYICSAPTTFGNYGTGASYGLGDCPYPAHDEQQDETITRSAA